MTNWEKKILDAFENRYFTSASETKEARGFMQLRSSVFFPHFDSASPDEKESYLEAAESLEKKGIVTLIWEKRGKGERLKTIKCEHFEKIFEEAGKPYPHTEAENIRVILGEKALAIEKSPQTEALIALLEYFSIHFGPREIGQRIDRRAMEELVRLLEWCCEFTRSEKITTRALSILLYKDSKRLESLLSLCKPLLSRAQKTVSLPDIAFLERSYPETLISGKIVISYNNEKTPLINAGGHILGLPFESAKEISDIQLLAEKKDKTVLTIENKETFYALGSRNGQSAGSAIDLFDCFLYVGGYSNRASAALVKSLAASGFSFYHAGDLDPDGILILQHIRDIAQKPVIPLRMDVATFDQYRMWARKLEKSMLQQIGKIREETKAIHGLADLLRRIDGTGLGVEQEIVDYRFLFF